MIINSFMLGPSLANAHVLLSVIIISFFVKTYFLVLLLFQRLAVLTAHKPWIFLLGTLAGSMFGDIAWMMKLLREIALPISYATVIFFIRVAWAFLILQYQSLSFFIQSLTEKNFTFNQLHKLLLIISSFFVGYFLYVALFSYGLIDEKTRGLANQLSTKAPLEITVMRYTVIYLLNLLVLPGLYFTFKRIKTAVLPKILKKQLKIFVIYLLTPYLIVEFLQAAQFYFNTMHDYLYPIVSISTLLLTYAIYYCMKKVMTFRFLNITEHVQSPPNVDIISDFKSSLEQLNHTTTLQELSHITKTFFEKAFNIEPQNNILFIRNLKQITHQPTKEFHKIEHAVEYFFRINKATIGKFIKTNQILVYDEIVFSHFYKEKSISSAIIKFLDEIHADIFIPIYNNDIIIAYLIIDKNARISDCYSKTEQDEMLVFINYLGNIINILQNKNINELMHQEKKLEEKIYLKHQEVNQYKESIRSFFRSSSQPRQVGIIFYKNRNFIYGNQAAKKLIKININHQEGYPLSKTFKTIAQQVSAFKSPQSCLSKDGNGNMLIITGMPHLDQNSSIFTVSYPDITDIISQKIDYLINPAQWNYLLYLETTKLGQTINEFVPASGEVLLNFKIELFRAALSKNAILVDAADEDLLPTVKLLHYASNRETLHVLNITKRADVGSKLFGINPIFNDSVQGGYPLLSKLNDVGTLFVKNIHFCNYETQERFNEFIRFGFYRMYKSDQKVLSNVRVICSTNQNVQQLIQENSPKSLFVVLKKNKLTMPSLITLPEEELLSLAEGFTDQTIKSHALKNFFSLTERDKEKLIRNRPTSFQGLKTKIQHLLIQKSKKSNIYQEKKQIDSSYTIDDPELTIAAQLGKQALKDKKIMRFLWNKFKNQNKISTFLGVNRSSVNRRCKEYNLE